MKLHLKETSSTEPTEWFQLYVEHIPTNSYWPTKGIVDYVLGDLQIYNALDVEADAYMEFYNNFVEEWPPFAETPLQTKLRICLAIDEINKRCGEKFSTLMQVSEVKPVGSYEPKPFSNL